MKIKEKLTFYPKICAWLSCEIKLPPIVGSTDIIHYNQRTSGPVNAHLTRGPGIYFNDFIHVYSPRAGADNPLGTNVDVNRSLYHFAHLLQVLKQSL